MCDTLVQVSRGRVLFAKSSDRDPNEAQALEWHPAKRHSEPAVKATYIAIPQARETLAVLLSRPFWMWGAEMGANEAGVVIGNEAVFTRSAVPAEGLTGMDLVRLTLERASSAREGVEILLALAERHGQGGGCGHEDRSFRYHSSFILADLSGAFVLETSGRAHAVEEIAPGEQPKGRSISNALTIEPLASQQGRWLHAAVASAAVRRATTESCAKTASSVADLFATLRDHGHGRAAPSYSIVSGALSAPCVHGGGLVASSQTTASLVSELSPSGARHWATGTAAPCTALFKPVSIDEPVDIGPEPSDRLDERCLWWRHERLHRAVMRDPERLLPLFRDERDEVERQWVKERPSSASAFALGDELLERWYARVRSAGSGDKRPWWVRSYQRRRDQRAGLG